MKYWVNILSTGEATHEEASKTKKQGKKEQKSLPQGACYGWVYAKDVYTPVFDTLEEVLDVARLIIEDERLEFVQRRLEVKFKPDLVGKWVEVEL